MQSQNAIIAGTALAFLLVAGACSRDPATPPSTVDEVDAGPTETAPPALSRTMAPPGARVFFIKPADGDVVSNPIGVEFGIEGMTVVKAGDDGKDDDLRMVDRRVFKDQVPQAFQVIAAIA